MVDDCPNCGRPLEIDAKVPVEICVCPGCGMNLDKPIKVGRQVEGLPDETRKKYRKLLEG